MLLNDPAVQAALINAVSTIVGTIIAGVTAALVGKKILRGHELQAELKIAQADIDFLLAVEKEYGDLVKETLGTSHKLKIRHRVRAAGLTWSTRHTVGMRNARAAEAAVDVTIPKSTP